MNKTKNQKRNKVVLYLALGLVLAACLWIGWHDFDPRIPQAEVRENIRSGIRWTIQLAIQYFVPINILVYFAQDIIAGRRMRRVQNGCDK
ncbi:MAG: hypothetical protein ACREPB_03345 [Arenimonas sp.]